MRPQLFNLFAAAPTLAVEIAAAQSAAPTSTTTTTTRSNASTWNGKEWVETTSTVLQHLQTPIGGLGGNDGFNVQRWALHRERDALRKAADEAAPEVPSRGRRRL